MQQYRQPSKEILSFCDSDPVRPTDISDVAQSEAELTGGDAMDFILQLHPEWEDYIVQLDPADDTSIADILGSIQDLADNAGDDSVDVSEVDLSTTREGTLFFEQVSDLAIPATEDTRIVIESYGETLLDNIYTPGLDGFIHLDLREFVHENTMVNLPGHRDAEGDDYQAYMTQDGSGLYLQIIATHGATTDRYEFWVNSFRSEAVTRMSDIDRIDIPTDALIPLTVFREMNLGSAPVEVFLVTATRRLHLHDGIVADDGDGYLVSTDVPVSRIPYRMNEPFYLEFRIATGRDYEHETDPAQPVYLRKVVKTPVYRVTPAPAHQYLFLNDYGHYDILPMSGALGLTPEYELENAFRSHSVERAKATCRMLYTQNSGPLTRQAATVLSQLLLSRVIYFYVPGSDPCRIVIENPSVSIADDKPFNTASFSWRYAEQ